VNLSASAIVLRPRSVAEIMDLTCRLTFARSLALYLRLSSAVLLPPFLGLLALHYFAGFDPWLLWLIAIPVVVWLEAPFTIAASRVMFGETPSVMTILRAFWGRLGAYTGAMFIKALYLGFSALFIVGFFTTWPSGTLVPEAALLEGASATDAWARSKRLIAQRSSEAFVGLMALMLSPVTISLGFELFGQALVSDVLQLGKPFGELYEDGFTPFALAGLFMAAPFVATARFVHYIDTRTRADGWDIQVKFMAIIAKQQDAKGVVRA